MVINTEKELGDALKNQESRLEIEGDLANKVIKIRAAGKVAWAVAFGAIVVAVIATLGTAGSGGTSAPATVPALAFAIPVAASTLGASVTIAAVWIAVAAGGAAALNTLRSSYKEISRSDGRLILQRKK
jgi:hypothetical protein